MDQQRGRYEGAQCHEERDLGDQEGITAAGLEQ